MKVNRVTVALDTRYMVNPLTIAEQAEGAVIYGLTAALYGKITIKDGAPVQGNFDTYRMVRLAEAPKIDVHLVPSGGKVWGGAGEPATPPIPAAVANVQPLPPPASASVRFQSAITLWPGRHSRRISHTVRGAATTTPAKFEN